MTQAAQASPQSDSPTPPRRPRRRWIPILVTAAVLGAGFWVYDFYKDDIWPKRFGEVVPGLVYRSGQISPRLVEQTLQERGIKTLINLQANVGGDDPVQAVEQEAATRLGIDCFRFPLAGDGTGNIANYAGALTKLVVSRRAGKPVLIHCAAGTQRAGVAIAYYRVLVENRPASEAYAEMLRYGVTPRKDQPALNYLNDHMAELAGMLVDRGVIPKIPDPLPRFEFPKSD
jgi:protein tyrosine phosphatase (PTP) superfamily phosphohydrolase (DUF442 family)